LPKLLADPGADVIKFERLTGDQLRRTPPFPHGALEGEPWLLFAWYRNNERGIALDWIRLDTVPLLAELASSTDVVVVLPDRLESFATYEETPPHLAWSRGDNALCNYTVRVDGAVAPLPRDAVHVFRVERSDACDRPQRGTSVGHARPALWVNGAIYQVQGDGLDGTG
jgi:hypothetical protein